MPKPLVAFIDACRFPFGSLRSASARRRHTAGAAAETLEGRVVLSGTGWGYVTGAAANDFASDAATDAGGNFYVAGNFSGGVDLNGDGGADVVSGSRLGGLVAKYSPTGQLLWSRAMIGPSATPGQLELSAIDVDADGNAFVTGHFYGSMDVDADGTADLSDPAAAGTMTIFAAKYSATGNLLWAKAIGGAGSDQGNGVAVDADGGAVYVAGSFTDTIDLDAGQGQAVFQAPSGTTLGSVDGFLLRLNGATGDFVWARVVTGDSQQTAQAVAVDEVGQVYLTGILAGTGGFDGGGITGTVSSVGGRDAFLASYTEQGDLRWTQGFGGAQDDWSLDLAAAGGAVYATGYFGNYNGTGATADFDRRNDPAPGSAADGSVADDLASAGGADGFVARYDAATGGFAWATRFGGAGNDLANAVVIDAAVGTAYVGGTVTHGADLPGFGTVPGRDPADAGADALVAVISADTGSFTAAWRMGASSSTAGVSDAVFGLGLDGAGNVYAAGRVQGARGQLPFSKNSFLVGGGNDIFVTQFSATVQAVSPTRFYVVNDGSADQTYEYGTAGGSVENYALGSGNTSPRGAASTAAGDKVWVIDANKKVYVYNASGTLLGTWTANGLSTPEGIATNGTDVWVVDRGSDRVYRYANAATRLSGSQSAASSFALNSGNREAKGIEVAGSSLWVVNDTSSVDKVFRYSLTGSLQGSWTIDAANRTPTGITLDPTSPSDVWIVDAGTDRVYRYANAAFRNSGSQSAAESWALAAGNTNPQGIADPPAARTGTVSAPAIEAESPRKEKGRQAAAAFAAAERLLSTLTSRAADRGEDREDRDGGHDDHEPHGTLAYDESLAGVLDDVLGELLAA